MFNIYLNIRNLFSDKRGATLVEYGLLVALVGVFCIAAITLLGQNISSAFTQIASSL